MSIGILVLMFFLIAIGMPIGFAMGVSGAIGIILYSDFASFLGIIGTSPYRTAASLLLTTIPMFIFMANIASTGSIVKDLFNVANRWVGHVPGGMAIATILSSAGFGAVSGSSTASTATMANIATKQMISFGYNSSLSAGIVAVGGTIAILIPPSVPLVLFGILTESSIGKLLIAGIIPGILTTITFSIFTWLYAKRNPDIMPAQERVSWLERFYSLKSTWGFILLFLAVIVSIYSGFTTATEAAALGALVAIFITLLTKKLTWEAFKQALHDTASTTSMIFTIVIGATIFGYFLTITRIPQQIITSISEWALPAWSILCIVLLIYIVLGFFMDQIAILILTLPLVYPLMVDLGYESIFLGIIIVKTVEIGLLTPPLGMNVFVASSESGIPVKDVFRGVLPYVYVDLINLLILCTFPILSTWLPGIMR